MYEASRADTRTLDIDFLDSQQQQKNDNDNDDIFMIPLPLSIYEAWRSRGAVLGGGWWKGGEV